MQKFEIACHSASVDAIHGRATRTTARPRRMNRGVRKASATRLRKKVISPAGSVARAKRTAIAAAENATAQTLIQKAACATGGRRSQAAERRRAARLR